MDYEAILVEVADDGVATLTLNRPEALNAWTGRMAYELDHALRALDVDDDVRAIVITGAGRAFCAGADLSSGGGSFSARDPEKTDKRRESPPEFRSVPADHDFILAQRCCIQNNPASTRKRRPPRSLQRTHLHQEWDSTG